jgi:signal transduction histidine kinase
VDVDFRVSQADSGEAALIAIEKDEPDLILLDYKLPGITGLDVLQALSERKCEALVVMITAYASLETAVQATKIGAFDFLAKPFTPDELKAVVHKASKHFMIQRQAQRLAEERRQIRFEFLSVLAHELKSPLAAVEGNLFILRDHLAGEKVADYDPWVDRSIQRLDGMRKLIFDLLDLTRIESGQKQRSLSDVDLCAVASWCLETHQAMAAQKCVILRLESTGPVLFHADAGEMEIIFNNLVSNAIKYNQEGGSVAVIIASEPSLVKLVVRDTGIGMSAEEIGKLFGEFSRIKNEKTRNILGSGLGLSILRRLAALYGGSVEVTSQPGEGSTFTVLLSRCNK